ncbi:MAG TPA: dTDP-glucose 4,6-dehydratase [Lachnospiraceae bacterium]|nr:dTDP-glucose 4,6-dehydratase [Lachnospiraceae bacterium]
MNIYETELAHRATEPLPWDKLEGRRILLSGASGMIGKCIIDILMKHNIAAGNPVHILAVSRNEKTAEKRLAAYWNEPCFSYVSCDVNEPLPECGDIDYIIHAASNTHPIQYAGDPIGTITANVLGTRNLLDYGVSHGAKQFCFCSSVEVYGENRGDVEKFDEAYLGYIDCNTLRAGYPESKRLGETLCNAYRQAKGLPFTVARLSRVYGPTMLSGDSKAIAQFIRKAAQREDIVLKSEGNQKFSYTFVTDAAAGVLYTMLFGKDGEAYNVADKFSDITLKELAGYLAKIAGTKVVFELPKEEERRGYSAATKAMLDAARLERLGWKARVHMADGLDSAVQSCRESEEE